MKPYTSLDPEEVLDPQTLESFAKVDDFEGFHIDDFCSFSGLKQKVQLVIADRKPIMEYIQSELARYEGEIARIEDRIKALREANRTADNPEISAQINELRRKKSSIADSKSTFESEVSKVYGRKIPALGLYSHCCPALEIAEPTIILFRDAILKEAFDRGVDPWRIYSYVYVHELFHAYFDSPYFDKSPNELIEETFAEFATLTFIWELEKEHTPLFVNAYVEVGIKFESAPHYFLGRILFDRAPKEEREWMVNRYREISDRIDLNCNYCSGGHIYRGQHYSESEVYPSIREILNTNWP